jgi:hypothetical protein
LKVKEKEEERRAEQFIEKKDKVRTMREVRIEQKLKNRQILQQKMIEAGD